MNVTTVDTVVNAIPNGFKAVASALSYQWINCSTMTAVAGADSQSFHPTSQGNYAVILNVNGCTDTSACHSFAVGTGIRSVSENNFVKVNPNPTNGLVYINSSLVPIKEITVYNLLGEKFETYYPGNLNTNISVLNLNRYPAGIYFFHILTGDSRITVRKVVKTD